MKNNNYEFNKTHTQLAKGIAIILMMTHHLFKFPDKIKDVSYISIMPFWNQSIFSEKSFEFFLGDFAKICIAMYLFLSGYGLYMAYSKKGTFTFGDSVEKVIKFFIAYWKIFIIFIPIGLIWFSESAAFHFNIIEFMANFFALSSSYNVAWWFARLYIELLLLFPLVIWLLKRGFIFSIVLTLSLYIISFKMDSVFMIVPQLSFLKKTFFYPDMVNILFWQIVFCVGCLTAKYNVFVSINKFISRKNLDTKVFYISMILVIMLIRIGSTFVFESIGQGNATYIDFILAPLFILSCTNLINRNRSKNIVLALGKNSTNMWLTHTFFCYYYFQELVFLPKISILILIWLAVLSLSTSLVINFVTKLSYTMYDIVSRKGVSLK